MLRCSLSRVTLFDYTVLLEIFINDTVPSSIILGDWQVQKRIQKKGIYSVPSQLARSHLAISTILEFSKEIYRRSWKLHNRSPFSAAFEALVVFARPSFIQSQLLGKSACPILFLVAPEQDYFFHFYTHSSRFERESFAPVNSDLQVRQKLRLLFNASRRMRGILQKKNNCANDARGMFYRNGRKSAPLKKIHKTLHRSVKFFFQCEFVELRKNSPILV